MNNLTTFRHKYNKDRECWMTCFYRGKHVVLDEFGYPQVQYWDSMKDFEEMIDRIEEIDKKA